MSNARLDEAQAGIKIAVSLWLCLSEGDAAHIQADFISGTLLPPRARQRNIKHRLPISVKHCFP